jgi:UDP-glucose 4-epimerase
MTRVLVTGGAGFIGSHLVEALVERGDEVVVIDDLSAGSLENLEPFKDKITFIEGSIEDLDLLKENMKGVDLVFHQAAVASMPLSIEDPLETTDVNLEGTLKVMIAARDAGVKRVVYASSAAVYGNSDSDKNDEDDPKVPLSPYAIQKLACEYYGKLFMDLYELETVGLRYFNVFGERQDPSSPYSGVISKFVDVMKAGESPTIFGDGEQTRDFVYVKDVVAANLLASEKEGVGGDVFNIGTGETVTIKQLTETLNEILETSFEPTFEDARDGDIKHSCSSIQKAQEKLGYAPTYDLEKGLRSLLS